MNLTNGNSQKGDVLKGMVAGVIGGLAASLAMDLFQNAVNKIAENMEMSENDSSKKSSKKRKKKEQEPATVKAAEAITDGVFGHKLTKDEKKIADPVMHYAMGATSGAIYGAAAEFSSLTTVGEGLPFGTAVWLIADDVVVPALGLSKPPTEYPFSTHAYALSSHLVYGLTTEVVRKLVRKAL